MQHATPNAAMAGTTAARLLPDPATFAAVLGQAAWLMTMSKAHRDLLIHALEGRVALPILLKQFRLYTEPGGKPGDGGGAPRPVAFLTWALASDAVRDRLASGEAAMGEADWRSGPHPIVVDVVSPFADPAQVRAQWEASLRDGNEGPGR